MVAIARAFSVARRLRAHNACYQEELYLFVRVYCDAMPGRAKCFNSLNNSGSKHSF